MKIRKTVQCEVCGKTERKFRLFRRRNRIGYNLCKQCKKKLKTSGVVCFDEEE